MTPPPLGELRRAVQAAVEQEGLRPFAERSGVPLGVVRSVLSERSPKADSIHALAKFFDFDFYVGPHRRPTTQEDSFTIPEPDADGFSEPPPSGYGFLQSGEPKWVRAPASLDQEFGPAGAWLLLDQGAEIAPDDRVLVGALDGRLALGRVRSLSPDWIELAFAAIPRTEALRRDRLGLTAKVRDFLEREPLADDATAHQLVECRAALDRCETGYADLVSFARATATMMERNARSLHDRLPPEDPKPRRAKSRALDLGD